MGLSKLGDGNQGTDQPNYNPADCKFLGPLSTLESLSDGEALSL